MTQLDFLSSPSVGEAVFRTVAGWWQQRGVLLADDPTPSRNLTASAQAMLELITKPGAAAAVLRSGFCTVLTRAAAARCIPHPPARHEAQPPRQRMQLSIQPFRAAIISIAAELCADQPQPNCRQAMRRWLFEQGPDEPTRLESLLGALHHETTAPIGEPCADPGRSDKEVLLAESPKSGA